MDLQPIPDLAGSLSERRFTVAEFEAISAAGVFALDERLELVQGKIVSVLPASPLYHSTRNTINQWLVRHTTDDAVQIINRGALDLADDSQPQPDLTIVQARPDYYASAYPRPADVLLIIEVADNALLSNRRAKLLLYSHAQIPEIWIINLVDKQVEVYTGPQGTAYPTPRIAKAGDTLTPTLLPSLILTADEILR